MKTIDEIKELAGVSKQVIYKRIRILEEQGLIQQRYESINGRVRRMVNDSEAELLINYNAVPGRPRSNHEHKQT